MVVGRLINARLMRAALLVAGGLGLGLSSGLAQGMRESTDNSDLDRREPSQLALTIGTALGYRIFALEAGLRVARSPKVATTIAIGIGGTFHEAWPQVPIPGTPLILEHVSSSGVARGLLSSSIYQRDGHRGMYFTAGAGLQVIRLTGNIDDVRVGSSCWIFCSPDADFRADRTRVVPVLRLGAGHTFAWANGHRLELGGRAESILYGKATVPVVVSPDGESIEMRPAWRHLGRASFGIAVELTYAAPIR